VNKSILGNALTNTLFINGFIQNFSRDAAMDDLVYNVQNWCAMCRIVTQAPNLG